jgi:hypothetical protein
LEEEGRGGVVPLPDARMGFGRPLEVGTLGCRGTSTLM